MLSFHQSVQEELQHYEQTLAGTVPEIVNFENVGRFLISLRIKNGWTQKHLAEKLGVAPAQVCRDEKNEYFGISIERAKRIFDALGVYVRLTAVFVDTTKEAQSDGITPIKIESEANDLLIHH